MYKQSTYCRCLYSVKSTSQIPIFAPERNCYYSFKGKECAASFCYAQQPDIFPIPSYSARLGTQQERLAM